MTSHKNSIVISGQVLHGQKYGRALGFPTANLDRRSFSRRKMKIRLGVWSGYVVIGKGSASARAERDGLRINDSSLQADVCAGFQNATVDVLVTKTMRAVKEFGAKSVSLSGGVAANKALRESLTRNSKLTTLNFFAPPQNLCTDNAEMIGLAACFMLHNGYNPKSFKNIKADPNLTL